jgi:vacuolar-type H+-ATPase catalytic subunit A/Vma1
MFEKKDNSPVKYPRCKSAWYFNGHSIKKEKIYGHWFRKKDDFRILIKQQTIGRNENQTKKVWHLVKPSDYDTDLAFIINIAINHKQNYLEKVIQQTKDWINNVPNLIKEKEAFIEQLKQAKQKISKENFEWGVSPNKLETQLSDISKVQPLSISEEHEKLMYLAL